MIIEATKLASGRGSGKFKIVVIGTMYILENGVNDYKNGDVLVWELFGTADFRSGGNQEPGIREPGILEIDIIITGI